MRRRAIARAARSVVLLVAVLFAVAAAVPAVEDSGPAVPPSATPGPAVPPSATPAAAVSTYLALGDSVPFGYRGDAPSYRDPVAFVGYPEKIAPDRHLRLLNASCPGETTGSFLDPQAPNNGCESSAGGPHYRGTFPLHVDYGTSSQMEYAEQVLTDDRSVGLVTLQLGANDAFRCQATTPDRCTSPAEGLALIQRVQANLTTIVRGLRSTGYRGPIVVVTYYALNADTSGTQALDAGIAGAARGEGALVADGFAAFQGPADRAGGDSIAAGLVLPDDVHPTDQGQRLLADAVAAALR